MSNKAFFVGDHAALDFLNTIAAPRGEIIEFIPDGGAYVTWLTEAGLLDHSVVQDLLDRFGGSALDRVAGEARDLREWFRQVITTAATAHMTWPTADVIPKLNQLLAMSNSQRQLEISGRQLALRERHEYTRARQLLVPIAQVIAELVTDGDPSLIKLCANPPCTLWFYDRTKAHRRRFCSAAVCGNRAKVAAFRERQRQSK